MVVGGSRSVGREGHRREIAQLGSEKLGVGYVDIELGIGQIFVVVERLDRKSVV